MYICENCGKQVELKYGSGRFCCKACANVRHHSNETKQKISSTLSGRTPWNKGTTGNKHIVKTAYKQRVKNISFVPCAYCGKQIDISLRKKNNNNRYFCNGTCRNRLLNSTKEIGGLFKGYNTSTWEKQVQDLLKKYNIEFEANKRDLISSRYEIDIWLPQQKIAIELNGIWHYSSKPYGGDEEALRKKQLKDKIKKQEVENLGYKFFAFEDRNIKDVNLFFDDFIKNEILGITV